MAGRGIIEAGYLGLIPAQIVMALLRLVAIRPHEELAARDPHPGRGVLRTRRGRVGHALGMPIVSFSRTCSRLKLAGFCRGGN
jgi:hypothetical protein